MSHGKQHQFMSNNLVVPVVIAPCPSGWSGLVPDFPTHLISGDTAEDALLCAAESLPEKLEFLHDEGIHVPDLSGIDYWRTHEDYAHDNWLWAVVVIPRPDWWPYATNV